MFTIYDNAQLHVDQCTTRMTKQGDLQKHDGCALTEALKERIKLQYKESSDISFPDDYQCSIDSEFTVRLVCSHLCTKSEFGVKSSV